MLEYCEEPNSCRRKMCIEFLGEKFDAKKCNRMCDNCIKDNEFDSVDVSDEARTVL